MNYRIRADNSTCVSSCICTISCSHCIIRFCAIIVFICIFFFKLFIVKYRTWCRIINTVILRLRSFQLGYANSICILRTSCDVSNLTGNDWSSYVTVFILFFCTTDGNSGSFRLPNASRISAVVISRRIITDYIRIDRSYRINTEGYAAIDLGVGIMANHDCIFEVFGMFYWCFSCYFFCPSESEQIMHDCFCLFHRIHRTNDDVIITTIQLVVITNHNGFV